MVGAERTGAAPVLAGSISSVPIRFGFAPVSMNMKRFPSLPGRPWFRSMPVGGSPLKNESDVLSANALLPSVA